MIYKVDFPKKLAMVNDRYYHIHHEYLLGIMRHVGCNVELSTPLKKRDRFGVLIDCIIDGRYVIFDFSDFEEPFPDDIGSCHSYFKFHYSDKCKQYKNAYPFSPVNFHNWKEYYEIRDCISYKAIGIVKNNQIPRAGAKVRRSYVQRLLIRQYGHAGLDLRQYSQRDYFLQINNALVSVCVPGARNNMLDRGQGQYMFLGACTISPNLVTTLSYGKKLIPGHHYVVCKDDYSDLVEKIEWVRSNKDQAVQIGQNAKSLFLETSTPEKQIEWIAQNL